jgi:hypothetical protein
VEGVCKGSRWGLEGVAARRSATSTPSSTPYRDNPGHADAVAGGGGGGAEEHRGEESKTLVRLVGNIAAVLGVPSIAIEGTKSPRTLKCVKQSLVPA